MQKTFAIILILFLSSPVSSQEFFPPRFLMIHPSPQSNGMAGAVSGLPTDDPFGVFFNPAQLAEAARFNNFSTAVYLGRTCFKGDRDRLFFDPEDFTFASYAFTSGYRFTKIAGDLDLIAGIGYDYFNLNLDESVVTDENGNVIRKIIPETGYHNFSLAVGLDYYLQLSLGYTYKHIYFDGGPGIQVGPVVNDDYQSSSAYDLGLILTIPCADLYNKAAATELKWFGTIVPAFNISLGTTMLNIGDTMEFWGFSSRLPRQAKIGYGLSLELTGALRSQAIRFLRFDWACEAEDILTDLSRSDAEYRSYPGNIKFWNNVILGKTDGEVIINNGLSLALFEFLEFRWGRRNLPGDDLFYNYTSSGFTVSSKGPLLLLADYAKTDMINWIAAHLELKYSSSKYRSDALFMIDRFDGLFLNVTIFQQANTHF